jgi:hypothetical protein
VEFAINNAVHSSTKETPFFLNYGVHPLTPLSMQSPTARAKASKVPAAAKFTADMQAAVARAKQCMQGAQDRMKAVADKRRADHTVAVGDMVWLDSRNIALKHTGSRKLLPRRLGPFKVVKEINPVAFRLQLPATMKKVHPVFHVSLLTPFKDGGRQQPSPPPVVLEDGVEEFEVEAVTGHRYSGKRLQYLIKFKGYGHEQNEWLPKSHLSCDELVQEYLDSPAYQRSVAKIQQKAQRRQPVHAPVPIPATRVLRPRAAKR